MKIATWNVNSLSVRLPHLTTWVQEASPDVVCLQETKVVNEKFPEAAIRALGYEVVFSGQPAYNGVAILSRLPCTDIETHFPGDDDPQRRLLAATVGGHRIVNVYVPNGQAVGSEKFAYKLAWLSRLQAYLKTTLQTHEKCILLGDFNIAPTDLDVHDPLAWDGGVLISPEERACLAQLVSLGLTDAFRLFHEGAHFSWWDYRAAAFARNHGVRIDHILLSASVVPACVSCVIDKSPRAWERPSDHVPVMAEIIY